MVSSGQSSAMWSGLVTAHSHQAQHLQHHDTEATEPLLGIFTEPQCRELKTTRTTSFFPKDIVVQSLSCVWLCDPMDYSTPGFPVLYYLLEFAQTHVHWLSDAIPPFILCHPLFLLPSISPSIRVFSNESVLCNRWPNYWSFSFSISSSNDYWGLISWLTDLISLLSKGVSRVFSSTTVRKHQLFGAQPKYLSIYIFDWSRF